MERKPLSTGSIVGAVVLLVVVLLGLYVGGYFALCWHKPSMDLTARGYRYDWLACSYRPVAWIEAAATGKLVRLFGDTWFYDSDGNVEQIQ